MSDHLERLKRDRIARQGWLSPPDIGWLIAEVQRLEDENQFLAKVIRRHEAVPAASGGEVE